MKAHLDPTARLEERVVGIEQSPLTSVGIPVFADPVLDVVVDLDLLSGQRVHDLFPSAGILFEEFLLDAFRAGIRDVAESWITLEGKLLHIRYFAIRDKEGVYRGCLEVGQDITDIRELDGERRLLDWDD